MANTGIKGIDCRQTGNKLLIRVFETINGNVLATGTTTVEINEYQDDGTLKALDFNDSPPTFKTTAVTTQTQAMTHQTTNNSTVNTGVWTKSLTSGQTTNFTTEAMYQFIVRNSTADAPVQIRDFQWGSAEGDLKTMAVSTGLAALHANTTHLSSTLQTARDIGASVVVDQTTTVTTNPTSGTIGDALLTAMQAHGRRGTAQAGAATTITLDSGANSTDGAYVGDGVFLTGGTGGGIPGTGQFRTIVAYNGTTKVATINRAWGTNPASDTTYALLNGTKADVFMILNTLYGGTAGKFMDQAQIANPTATVGLTGTTVDLVNAPNATAISAIATGLLDLANGVESTKTVRQILRLMAAALLGKVSNAAAGNPIVFRDTNDTKDRISSTTDAAGDRTAVTLDAS